MEQAIIPMEEYKALKDLKDESLIIGITTYGDSQFWYTTSKIKDEISTLKRTIEGLRHLVDIGDKKANKYDRLIRDIKRMSIRQFIKWRKG